jgi:hypothetical protein
MTHNTIQFLLHRLITFVDRKIVRSNQLSVSPRAIYLVLIAKLILSRHEIDDYQRANHHDSRAVNVIFTGQNADIIVPTHIENLPLFDGKIHNYSF